jgi:hypothetical protein
MQNTSTQIVTTETTGSWLRRLTVFMLVLLIIEFITGEITNLFVTLPSAHPGAASSGFSGFVPGLGWALTQSRLSILQVHGAIGLLLVLLALVLLGLAMVRRQRPWVLTSLLGAIGVLIAAVAGVGFVNTGQAASSLLMALGFLLALIIYAMGLYVTRPRQAVR